MSPLEPHFAKLEQQFASANTRWSFRCRRERGECAWRFSEIGSLSGGIDEGGRTMWVRVATFECGDTEKLEKLMNERMSSGDMTAPEGMNSALVLDDQDGKKRKFLAFFDGRDTLEAAEAGFDQQGDTIPEDIRGKRTSVHYYDVVVYDGEVDAAKAARVSLLEGQAD